jgi:hypothetical protein
MGSDDDPGRETQDEEQEAVEEMHRLFERNRETAHHGRVSEHDEPPELRPEDSGEAPAPPGR